MMPHAGMLMEPERDPVAGAIERISLCNYKFVQTMASERKLPANLKKRDMAKLIALFDAGAEAELNRLLSSLKETRSRTRRVHAAQGGGHGGGSPAYPGYVTTTAEADSASASPDLDDDEEDLLSPMAVEDDGDEDYDPSGPGKAKKHRPTKAPTGGLKQPSQRPSYDMAASPPCPPQLASPSMASMASMGPTPAMAPGGPSRPHHQQHPAAAGGGAVPGPAAGPSRMAWQEEAHGGQGHGGPGSAGHMKQAVPSAMARRPAGPVGHAGGGKAMKPHHPARMSKTGRVIKPPRRDGSYVYAKIPHHQNSMSYPPAGSPSPAYRQSATLESGVYDSPHAGSQADGYRAGPVYGHGASSPAAVPATCSIGSSGALKPWSVPTPVPQAPMPSLQPIGNSAFSRNAASDAFKPYNGQHVQSKVNSPSVYTCSQQPGYGQTSFMPMSQSYPPSQQIVSEDVPLHIAPVPPTPVIRPIPLPAAPSNDFSSSLEWIVNVKADNLQMPLQLSPYWKPANTNSVNSYSAPISITSSSRRSSLFQDPTRALIQPYMPPISSNPLYSQHSSTPGLHHSRQFKEDFQIPASAQCAMLQAEQQAGFYGAMHRNHGSSPLHHGNANPFVEDYRPGLASPTNPPAIDTYQDQQNWQHQEPLDPWMQEPEEQKYHPPELVRKQHKQMHVENQQKSFMLQQTHKNHHQQYHSMPSTRQSNPVGQVRQTSFQGSAPAQLHRTGGTLKRPSNIPCKTQPTPSPSQRHTRDISSSSPHSLSLNQGHHSAYQQHAPHSHQAQQVLRSSHNSPTRRACHQPVKTEYVQGPVRKKPCYQLNEDRRHLMHPDKQMQNQVSLPNRAAPQSHPIDVPSMLPFPNPDFRKNNEISYPLIYDYLTSAEKQLEPIGSKPDSYPEASGNDIHFPTDLPSASQNNFVSSANVSSSFIEEVIPSLTQHVLHTKQKDVLNSNFHTACPVSSPVSLGGGVVPHSTLDDCSQSTFGNIPLENSTFDNAQHVNFSVGDNAVGRVQHDGASSPSSVRIQNLDNPSYSEFAAVIVENVRSIQDFESQDYAQLVPVPVETSSLDDDSENHRDMQLRLIKALADPSLSLPDKNNNGTIPAPDKIDTTLGKVSKEDDKTKQVIFLCSDGTGEPEYMTLSVCQEEALNSSMNSLPGTVPSTPSNSDVGANNVNEDIVEKDPESLNKMSSNTSTLPVLNSDQSTDTASSIGDYLSQSRSALDSNTNEYLSDENTSAETTSDGDNLSRHSGSSSTTTSESSNVLERLQVSEDPPPVQVHGTITATRSSVEESMQAPSLLHDPGVVTADNVVPSCSASVLGNCNTESSTCQVPHSSVPTPLEVPGDHSILRHVPSVSNTICEATAEPGASQSTASDETEDVNSPANEKEGFESINKSNTGEDSEVPDVTVENKPALSAIEATSELLKNESVVTELSLKNLENADEETDLKPETSPVKNSEETDESPLKCSEGNTELSTKNLDATVEPSTQMDRLYSEHTEVNDGSFEKHSGFIEERPEATFDSTDQLLHVSANHTESILHIKEEPMDLTREEIDTNLASESDVRLPDPLLNINENDLCDACDIDEPESILPDVNMNTIAPPLPTDSALSASKVDDVLGHTSPLYLPNEMKEENSRPSSPLLRSKSASKIYPGKQVRQPVRCSPRQSVRAGPSYAQMSAALAQQKSLPLRVESPLHQPAKGRKPCPNVTHGCPLVLPPAQLSSHHLVCEYSFISCPAIGCAWECIAKKLSAHIREAHRPEIGVGTDSEHTVFFHEIRQQQRLTFLREVSRKLFVICIHAYDSSIFATMQYIASGRAEKPISATGTLEVIDAGGSPHAWRGKIGPIQQRLDTVRDSGNCLQIAPEILGAIKGATITFHTNIRVNISQNQTQSASTSESSV